MGDLDRDARVRVRARRRGGIRARRGGPARSSGALRAVRRRSRRPLPARPRPPRRLRAAGGDDRRDGRRARFRRTRAARLPARGHRGDEPDAGASRAERAPALARRDARRPHRRQRGPGHDRERLHPRRTGARGRPARDLGPGPRLRGHGRRARRRRALGRGSAGRRGRPARGARGRRPPRRFPRPLLFVVLALAALGLGEAGVGALNAALGLGGVLGAAWAGGLAGRAGLARWLALGVAAWGLGLVFAGALPSAPAVFALVVAGGAGRSLMDVTGRTLLQRLAAPDVLSRVFGVLEGSSMAALAIGALAAPVLVERLGSAAAFAAIGALLPVLLVIALPALRTADRRARVPERTLAIARRVPFFAALPAPSLERVAEALRPVEARAGSALVSEGERGDRFYVIERGTAAVSIGGRPVRTLGPGDHFGELALLRDAPRSATVRADSDVSLYALGRDEFLAALTAHPASARSAEAAARALQG
ncbi:MAG: MFS transporter [Chloroflexi bacterium]|nr:MAG: MFS transporter [Chloroflexota bacterium]